MHIIKLIIAGFLVSLNVFSFLLVKCQKNDREKKILESVAEGSKDINFDEQTSKPDENEQSAARESLLKANNNGEDNTKYDDFDTEYDMPKDKKQQKEDEYKIVNKYSRKPVSDLKLLLCSLLGGSVGIYIALFVFRYRLRDLLMMVLVPTILVINIYFYLQVFTVWLILPLNSDSPLAIIKLLIC